MSKLEDCGLAIPGPWFALQHRLRDVDQNARSVGMVLNEKKTTLMFFNFTINRHCVPFCALKDGQPLPVVGQARLLGIIVDQDLSWWPLVKDLVKRASVKLWSLVKLRDTGADVAQLVQVYIARVRSTVEYAAQVYDPLINSSQSDEIEHVQFKAVQIILGPRSKSYSRNLELLGLVTLAERRACLVRSFAIATYRSQSIDGGMSPTLPFPLTLDWSRQDSLSPPCQMLKGAQL